MSLQRFPEYILCIIYEAQFKTLTENMYEPRQKYVSADGFHLLSRTSASTNHRAGMELTGFRIDASSRCTKVK